MYPHNMDKCEAPAHNKPVVRSVSTSRQVVEITVSTVILSCIYKRVESYVLGDFEDYYGIHHIVFAVVFTTLFIAYNKCR